MLSFAYTRMQGPGTLRRPPLHLFLLPPFVCAPHVGGWVLGVWWVVRATGQCPLATVQSTSVAHAWDGMLVLSAAPPVLEVSHE
jgi:hypothetical protein